jgi:hypothetical protein
MTVSGGSSFSNNEGTGFVAADGFVGPNGGPANFPNGASGAVTFPLFGTPDAGIFGAQETLTTNPGYVILGGLDTHIAGHNPGYVLLAAGSAYAPGNQPGADVAVQAGNGVDQGGGFVVSAGSSSATNGFGGGISLIAGTNGTNSNVAGLSIGGTFDTGFGGDVQMGAGSGVAGRGGQVVISGGPGRNTAYGGAVSVYGGNSDANHGGDITLQGGTGTTRNGLIILAGLPTADPTVAGALWNNAGLLTISAG